MKIKELKQIEIEAMSYDDLAFLILEESKRKMKITDLFKKVCNLMKLDDTIFENKIADFFELLTTDKRFIMLEKGTWDLRERHSQKIKIESEEEDVTEVDGIDDIDLDEELEEVEEDIFYDSDETDDESENDLKDLVIIDEEEEASSI